MAKRGRDMRTALGDSMKAEESALEQRFRKADAAWVKDPDQQARPTSPTPEPVPATPKPARPKVERPTYSLLPSDLAMIDRVQERCMREGVMATKSALVRAGIRALEQMPLEDLIELIRSLEVVRAGRPTSR